MWQLISVAVEEKKKRHFQDQTRPRGLSVNHFQLCKAISQTSQRLVFPYGAKRRSEQFLAVDTGAHDWSSGRSRSNSWGEQLDDKKSRSPTEQDKLALSYRCHTPCCEKEHKGYQLSYHEGSNDKGLEAKTTPRTKSGATSTHWSTDHSRRDFSSRIHKK